MTLLVRTFASLSHNREGLRAAYLAANVLVENRWHDHPAPAWDSPAALAFDGEECVAGVNWTHDPKQARVLIDFAWCAASYPNALALVLIALRKALRELRPTEIRFTCHPANAPMMKLAAKLKLEPSSVTFKAPVDFWRPA